MHWTGLLNGLLALLVLDGSREVEVEVEVEEVVTTYESANNGAGPLWCYGAPLVVRHDATGDVYASTIETGKEVPPLCNTRWLLWRRRAGEWSIVARESSFRQREPCPLGLFRDGTVFLSVNPSTEPPGTRYGPCKPLVLEFAPGAWGRPPRVREPAWAPGTHFTDHSYRGFAVDGRRGEVLLLQINARTSAQFVSHRDDAGTWHSRGTIEFPIRAAYPQVALRDRAAHVLAIGDIVEPVEEWRRLKAEKTGSEWDYVFRRLFYTYTPDVASVPFAPPRELASVERSGGHIANLDLHVDARGDAHLLYLERPHANRHIHDRYFPDEAVTQSLRYAIVRRGEVVSRATLASSSDERMDLDPSYARFHVAADGRLCVIVAGHRTDEKGGRRLANVWSPVGEVLAGEEAYRVIPLLEPFTTFFTSAPRGGSPASNTVDLFGATRRSGNLHYARLRVAPITR